MSKAERESKKYKIIWTFKQKNIDFGHSKKHQVRISWKGIKQKEKSLTTLGGSSHREIFIVLL